MLLMPKAVNPHETAIVALRRRMRQVELTQSELAQKVGRVQGWVSSRLFNDPDATLRFLAYKDPAALERLLAALNWTLVELNEATGLDIPLAAGDARNELQLDSEDLRGGARTIPVYDLLSAGPGGDGGTVIDTLDIPDSWKGRHAAYEVTGDSMAPDIPNGARVVIKVQDYATPGNEIVCWVPDHGMVVKRLDQITPDEQYVLVSYNPAYRPIWAREIVIYGVVREIRLRRPIVNGNHGPN